MNNEQKDAMIASVEAVQAIEQFLQDYYSVYDLFETAANAGSIMLELVNLKQLSEDDVKMVMRLIDQHVMIANLLRQVSEKGGAV